MAEYTSKVKVMDPPGTQGVDEKAESLLGRALAVLYAASAIAALATYVAALLLGLYLFFFTAGGQDFSSKILSSAFLSPYFRINLAGSLTAGSLFLVLSLIFAMAFASAALSCKGYLRSVGELLTGRLHAIPENFLLLMPVLSSSLLIAFSLMHGAEESVGIPVGSINFPDPLSEIMVLSYAVVIEEATFRLVPLAFPIALYLILYSSAEIRNMPLSKRIFMTLLALLKPSTFMKRLGIDGGRGFALLKITLLAVTSALFAYAHIASGTWGVGKVSTSFLAGLALGYCLLRFGFDSAILLHWFFNSYWGILSASAGVGGFFAALNEASLVLTIILAQLSLIIIAFAAIFRNNLREF